jgi:hypothetical protein
VVLLMRMTLLQRRLLPCMRTVISLLSTPLLLVDFFFIFFLDII